jgi:pimeloyl-ACP methyl ester carboxylesterase
MPSVWAALAIGHSMGAAALLMCEARPAGHVRGLALYEPIVFSDERLPDDIERPAALVEGCAPARGVRLTGRGLRQLQGSHR